MNDDTVLMPRELAEWLKAYMNKGGNYGTGMEFSERFCELSELLRIRVSSGALTIEQVARMPIERCYDVRAKMIIAFNESKKNGGDLDDCLDAAYKSALRFSPAPASVVQPANCSCPSGDGSLRWPCPVHPPEPKS